MKGNQENKHLPYQSEFSHRFASWARNHNGWAKMKRKNKRLAKAKIRREIRKEIDVDT